MSARKILGISCIVVIIAMAVSATALANPQGFSLKVVPQVSFVSSGQNVVVNFTATNGTGSSATCDIYVEEIAFDATPGGIVIGAGQTAGGQLSTPANAKNGKLTFDLICGGIVVKDSVNVKVR